MRDLLIGTIWLRNSPRYGAFHLRGVELGKATCGQDLSRPSIAVTSPMPGVQKLCKVCLGLLTGEWARNGGHTVKRSERGNP